LLEDEAKGSGSVQILEDLAAQLELIELSFGGKNADPDKAEELQDGLFED